MSQHPLSHIDTEGAAQMVDISPKQATQRRALASGILNAQKTTIEALISDTLPKKEAIATARISGIMAAKKTGDLIPLCHPLGLDWIDITIRPLEETSLLVTAETKIFAKTGVEMEALTAVSITLLTLYDMAKAVDKSMKITNIHILEKEGGKNEFWKAGSDSSSPKDA